MRVTIIGSGNVGYHLSQRLKEVGHQIVQMYSRTTTKVVRVARVVDAMPIDRFSALTGDADLYIIAVKDDAIQEVAQKMSKYLPVLARVVHTSGTVSSEVLMPYFKNNGVFYPLQSFSIARLPDFSNLPILVYAGQKEIQTSLEKFARTVSPKVYVINDEERAKLHVTAVLVNNFTNHLFAIAEDILAQENLPNEILLPLIQETVKKIEHIPAKTAQTGPAKRNDQITIQRHLQFLEKYKAYQEVYEVLSESLMEMYRK